jgi:hypothetical protein
MNNGIGFIVWDEGFACSDEVVFDIERDPVIDPEGKKNITETKTLKYISIFEGAGLIVKGLKVRCLFKSGEKKYAFTGEVRGKSGNLTIIDINTKSDRINEIIEKIKSFKGGK